MYPARQSASNALVRAPTRSNGALRLVQADPTPFNGVDSATSGSAGRQDPYFPAIRCVPLGFVASVVLAHLLLKVLFFSKFFLYQIVIPLEAATAGFVSAATLIGCISLVVLVGLMMMLVGSLRLSDLGFNRNDVKTGSVTLLSLLAAVHVFAVIVVLISGTALELSSYPIGQLLVATSDAFLGASLVEECLYRGFLLVQVYFLIADRSSLSRPTSLILSIMATQSYFGISHIGSAMRMGLEIPVMTGYIFQCILVGVMLAVLFIRTRSLIVSIVAHGMLNLSPSVVDVPIDMRMLTLVAVCLLMMSLPYIYHRDHRRFSLMWLASSSARQTTGDVLCDSIYQQSSSVH